MEINEKQSRLEHRGVQLNVSSRIRLVILVFYWVCGFIATHIPIRDTDQFSVRNLDKIAHFVLYLFLSLLMAYWLGSKRTRHAAFRFTLIICTIYALLDEGVQTLIPSRVASIGDLVANFLGIIAGLFIYVVARGTGRKSNNGSNSRDQAL